MVIITQDKKSIVNFDRVQQIRISELQKGKIYARFSDEYNNPDTLLGEYASEVRAMEVMEDIRRNLTTLLFGLAYEMPEE